MIRLLRARILACILLAAAVGAGGAQAHVAITEVMTDAAIAGPGEIFGNDYIELTHFGSEPRDLTGYSIHDDGDGIQTNVFNGLVLGGGEVVLLVRMAARPTIRSREEFFEWWGSAQLPPDLQVRFYDRPGLNSEQDELWLRDPAGNVVDFVRIREGRVGQTLVHDPATGVFGALSRPGVAGAFRALRNPDDIGSPGFAPQPIPVRIMEHPVPVSLDGCGDVQFSVKAGGLPAPRYQWFRDDEPIAGETEPVLRLRDAGMNDVGAYTVRVGNALGETNSNPATLTVRRDPKSPYFTRVLPDVMAFPGQTVLLEVEARGHPCPDLQWFLDGQAIEEQTGRTLSVRIGLDEAVPRDHRVMVRAFNSEGEATATTRIRVRSQPRLLITEVMVAPDHGQTTGRQGWFEVTNEESEPVPLDEFRFRDVKGGTTAFPPGLFEAAYSFPPGASIGPGESVVCVEDMTADEFREWWGEDRLPPGLQIFTWVGFGLSQSGEEGLYLWNRFPAGLSDAVCTASWLGTSNDGPDGLSEELEHEWDTVFGGWTGFPAGLSRRGVAGAFRAGNGMDVGSPGYRQNPGPRWVGSSLEDGVLRMRWRVPVGRFFRLRGAQSLGLPWTSIVERQEANDEILTLPIPVPPTETVRFFQLEEVE